MKKRRLGLIKKVSELTILCGVKACLVIFSPNEVEPMLFPPSADAVRDLLDRYFALPIIEQKKKETSLEAYLKNKTSEAEERLRKIQKKNLEDEVVKLMKQLRLGRSIGDFSDGEISKLLSFTKEKILNFRKRLDPGQERPPLREPLVNLDDRFKELKAATTTNDVSMVPRGHGDDARSVQKTREPIKKISYKIFDALRGNQNYLMDQWFFPSPKPVSSQIRKEDLNPKSKLLDQGSGSNNGNPNLEMEPAAAEVGSPLMNFHVLAELMTQHSQIFNESMVMAMNQRPMQQQSPGLMSRGVQAREDISNNRNNDGPIRQEPPPTNEARDDQEGPIDINVVWPRTNNN
ncbi:unnamed protein product [Cochlearia groenlandica]